MFASLSRAQTAAADIVRLVQDDSFRDWCRCKYHTYDEYIYRRAYEYLARVKSSNFTYNLAKRIMRRYKKYDGDERVNQIASLICTREGTRRSPRGHV
jgi:hypothetical protein